MLWVKALHVVSVIAWMAAQLYLPRLLVYHAESPVGSDKSETFKIMERRLLRQIANPAMILTFVFGIWYATWLGAWSDTWLHVKLVFVLLLAAYHGLIARWVSDFARDERTHSARFFRMINELPALLMVVIVILVVVKPF
jgi:putative membrane protein